MIMPQARYRAAQAPDRSWCVRDVGRNREVVVGGLPSGQVAKRVAIALAAAFIDGAQAVKTGEVIL